MELLLWECTSVWFTKELSFKTACCKSKHYLVSQCFGFCRQTDPRFHSEQWGGQCGTEKSSNLGAVLQLRRFGDHPITQMTQPVLSLPQSCSEMGHVGWWPSCSWRDIAIDYLPPSPLRRSTNLPKKKKKSFSSSSCQHNRVGRRTGEDSGSSFLQMDQTIKSPTIIPLSDKIQHKNPW